MEPSAGRDIAIIGMACVFPGADTLDAFWQNIVNGRDAITDAPASWEMEVLYEQGARSNDRIYCQRGGYLPGVSFDPVAHGVLPRAAEGGEADQWLALDVAQRALDDAGYGKELPQRERTGVVLGKGNYLNRGNAAMVQHGLVLEQTMEGLRRVRPDLTDDDAARIRRELKATLPAFDTDTVPGLIPNIAASRIANRLNLMGPTYTIDAACASSLIAIDIANNYLVSGQCDVVIVGGVHVTMPGPIRQIFCQLGALSPSQQIRPFDAAADGTIPGDGVGMVVLKRVEDARRDGDRIYAVVKGVGVSSDGRGLSVMAPRVDGERLALRRAYEAAGLSPRTVSLIEAHGTGTAVGDPTEVDALQDVFGARDRDLPWCALGTVKSMIGHLMPAAGIAGVIKTALALHHKVLPPTLNVSQPIDALAAGTSAFYVNAETRPWMAAAAGHPRRAGVNAFGFSGVNAHVILEEAEDGDASFENRLTAWDSELCVVTAASRAELLDAMRQWSTRLEPDVPMRDVAFTLSQQPAPGPVRLAIVATSTSDLRDKLERASVRLADPACRTLRDPGGLYFFATPPSQTGKLAFLFPGEGSQYAHQLADLYIHFPSVRRWFDRANRAFAGRPDRPLPGEFLFPSSLWSVGERELATSALWSLDGAVASVLSANSALLELVWSTGLRADALLGHSTGELTALAASGMVDLHDESTADRFSAELISAHEAMPIQEAHTASLLAAIGTDARTVATVLQEIGGELHIAMENCSLQTVISGDRDAVNAAVTAFQRKGVLCERLEFNRPYHTPAFRRFVAPIADFTDRWITRSAHTPTYSCATKTVLPTDVHAVRRLTVDQWVAPVAFQETILAMHEDGFRTFVEVGARGNLSAFSDDILRGKPHLCIPLNVPSRSATSQLCHAFGLIAAAGYDINLAPLFAHRSARVLEPVPLMPSAGRVKAHAIPLTLGFPAMRLTGEAAAQVPSHLPLSSTTREQPPQPDSGLRVDAVQTSAQPGATVMSAHLQNMEQFLDVQREVMEAFLAPRALADAGLDDVAEPAPPRATPLLSAVIAQVPGQSAEATSDIDLQHHRYLGDHEFGRPTSRHDHDLGGVPVVPFTFSMEMMAEVASLVFPDKVVTGLRDVRGYQWIVAEGGGTRLRLVANVVEGARSPEVRVQVYPDNPGIRASPRSKAALVEGVVVLADAYPSPPAAVERSLGHARTRKFAPDDIYRHATFHGPAFRGLEHIDVIGTAGLSARVRILPRAQLVSGYASPPFHCDPVVMDVMGQAIVFWSREVETDIVCFPYRVGAVELYGPPLHEGVETTCRTYVTRDTAGSLVGDIELHHQGQMVLRCVDWEDRKFSIAEKLTAFWLNPDANTLSDRWPLRGGSTSTSVCAVNRRRLGESLASSAGGVWVRSLAACLLGRAERAFWAASTMSESRRIEWLFGRIAAKDAVRDHLLMETGQSVAAVDIELRPTPNGQPTVMLAGVDASADMPTLSISHAGDWAVAVAAAPGRLVGIDIEPVSRLASMSPDFLRTAIQPEEDALVPPTDADLWRLRFWCAKEAAAKACGIGLGSGLLRMRVGRADTDAGTVDVKYTAGDGAGRMLTVTTSVDRGYVVAICNEPA